MRLGEPSLGGRCYVAGTQGQLPAMGAPDCDHWARHFTPILEMLHKGNLLASLRFVFSLL
jgi:hypothetical protein